MNFKEELQKKVQFAEQIVESYLPLEEGYQKRIMEAMKYSLTAGGKRLRPVLMLESYQLFGGSEELIKPFMAAIEMIHTYSLVHDDLPAMDNDEYRRGRKTTHIVYGEALGILAGDALLNYAFETACTSFDLADGKEALIGRALQILGRKAGIYGMIGGQTVDIESENQKLSKEKLDAIYQWKTSALIQSSLMIGAVLAGASQDEIRKMEEIGSGIGLAFQIQDDILDVTSSVEVLGKPINSDEKNHKTTYVTLMGLEASKKEVEAISKQAVTTLEQLGREHTFLKELILYLIHREK